MFAAVVAARQQEKGQESMEENKTKRVTIDLGALATLFGSGQVNALFPGLDTTKYGKIIPVIVDIAAALADGVITAKEVGKIAEDGALALGLPAGA